MRRDHARRDATGTGPPASRRQGRRLCDPGARRDVHQHIRGSYSGVDGPAAVRDAELLARRARAARRRRRAMSIEILVNVEPRETRAALLENGVLQELFIERASRRGLVSNLYKGRVSRVLPGMQAAFLDIGLERTAFLHVADIVRRRRMPARRPSDEPRDRADIRELVREGDDILVQVVKDPLGTKGARLHAPRPLPSRYLVYMPRGHGVGVSARIESEAERAAPARAGARWPRRRAARGRLHRAHRGAGRARRGAARRHAVPAASCGTHVTRAARHAAPGNAGARGPAAAAARAARLSCATDVRPRAGGFTSATCDAHAGVRRAVHARARRPHRAATPGAAAASSTCTASRTRSARAGAQGAAEVRRPPRHRPDRGA